MNAPWMSPRLALCTALGLGCLAGCGKPSPAASPATSGATSGAAGGRGAPGPGIKCLGKISCEVVRVTDEVRAQLEAMTPPPGIVMRPGSQDDFATIARLPWVKELTLGGADVTGLEPLAGLKQLESLTIVGLNARTLAPLAGHPTLGQLSITAPYDLRERPPAAGADPGEIRYLDTGLDLASAGSLPALRSLKLTGVRVPGNLASLAGFSGLKEIELRSTQLDRDASLEGLPQLETFVSFKVTFGSLDLLARAPRLERVSLNSAGLRDLAPLASLRGLRHLSVPLNPGIVSLRPLAALTSLEKLEVNRTGVDDAAPLAGLKNLRSLDLSHTRVRSVDPLARLPALTSLGIVDTPVRDIKALKALKTLRTLDVPDEMPKEQIEALRGAIPGLKVRLSSGAPAGG